MISGHVTACFGGAHEFLCPSQPEIPFFFFLFLENRTKSRLPSNPDAHRYHNNDFPDTTFLLSSVVVNRFMTFGDIVDTLDDVDHVASFVDGVVQLNLVPAGQTPLLSSVSAHCFVLTPT